MKDTFLLVDGNSLMHRAFHALPPMDAEDLNRILAKRRVFLNDKTQAKAKDDDDWDY